MATPDTVESLAAELAVLQTAYAACAGGVASITLPTGVAVTYRDPLQLERAIVSKRTRLARLQALEEGREPFATRGVPA